MIPAIAKYASWISMPSVQAIMSDNIVVLEYIVNLDSIMILLVSLQVSLNLQLIRSPNIAN